MGTEIVTGSLDMANSLWFWCIIPPALCLGAWLLVSLYSCSTTLGLVAIVPCVILCAFGSAASGHLLAAAWCLFGIPIVLAIIGSRRIVKKLIEGDQQ